MITGIDFFAQLILITEKSIDSLIGLSESTAHADSTRILLHVSKLSR